MNKGILTCQAIGEVCKAPQMLPDNQTVEFDICCRSAGTARKNRYVSLRIKSSTLMKNSVRLTTGTPVWAQFIPEATVQYDQEGKPFGKVVGFCQRLETL